MRNHSTIFCLTVALTLRIAVCGLLAGDLTNDRDAYLGIARGIAAGNGFCTAGTTSPTAFRPPLYPLALAALIPICGEAIAVAALNVIAGTATVFLTIQLAERLTGSSRAAFIAGGLVAVDPLLILYCSQPMTEVLAAFLAIFTLWWIVPARGVAVKPSTMLLAGIGLGLCGLCRPTFWLWTAFLAGWSGAEVWKKRQPVAACAALILAAGLMLVPWAARNQLLFGKPILTTTHGGYTLHLANNPAFYRDVTSKLWTVEWPEESFRDWERAWIDEVRSTLGPQASETSVDEFHKQRAVAAMRAEPERFLKACVVRELQLWSAWANSGPSSLRWMVASFYLLEWLALLVGCWRILTRPIGERSRWLPLGLLILTFCLAHAVYWTNARMRAPFQPVLAIIAAMTFLPRPSLSPPGKEPG